jgi:hypothetical protein
MPPRNINPSSVSGLSAEARDAVNAAFDAMSTWRSTSRERHCASHREDGCGRSGTGMAGANC